jgi:hypothetical protein
METTELGLNGNRAIEPDPPLTEAASYAG